MELYKKKDKMVIYDCFNTVYPLRVFKDLFKCSLTMLLNYGIHAVGFPQFTLIAMLMIGGILYRHYRWTQIFVERIVYDPVLKEFTISKRNYYGQPVHKQVTISHLVYTSDLKLNKQGINYINMNSLELYSVVYKNAWQQLDFFSYLIKQNIKTHLSRQHRDST